MSGCTAPVRGHHSAAARADCPVCRYRSGYRSRSYSPAYYPPSVSRYPSSVGGSSSSGAKTVRTSSGRSVSFTAAESSALSRVRTQAQRLAQSAPDRRDLFLCHAWDDRLGAAKELHDHLVALGVTVWFSEVEVTLGTLLLREIDKGLRISRIGMVLVTPSMFKSLNLGGIADKELSALLATDRVIPITHGTTFDELRDVSPLLAARSGLSTEGQSLEDVAAKIADTVRVELSAMG